MKLTITENKLNQVIKQYLSRIEELQNLEEVHSHYYIHSLNSNKDLVQVTNFVPKGLDGDLWSMSYYPYPSSDEAESYDQDALNRLPLLEVSPEISEELNGMFGKKVWEDAFIEWFEEKFGYDVKVIYYFKNKI